MVFGVLKTKCGTIEETSGGPITAHGNERSVTVRGLRPKTRYFFRVKCLNALGESQYGAEVAVTTLEERRYRDLGDKRMNRRT
ncbi:uncharacterized protein TNIN_33661 [Trichonephila inaurata madagascariensis]|uniref:Fibronectin type-III domain-containing protein n=1 Tax=Trichonephila inaurata madagascariensis TaxID=2747483 RepID=A0A8X6XXF8_9ARAC|nr:uncharacterized protein TNIN_33661 [Trichonephila inaurata madagascariensis]